MVHKGFNSDIVLNGLTYHVQTEDWGFKNPFFVSQIFSKGAVIKTIKIPYTKVLPDDLVKQPQAVIFALKTQHNSVLDLLVAGQIPK